MKLKIAKDLSLIYDKFYPYKNRNTKSMRYRVLIGIGGNIGDVKLRFKSLFLKLQKDKRVELISTSPLLENPPFGFLEQNQFLNGVISLYSSLAPIQFLKFCNNLEFLYKRERKFKNSPRTLDIDVIFFDTITINKSRLIVPHPKWKERVSVILPMILLGSSI